MDEQERKNWETVKAALEKADKTDTMFYKRAVAICDGKKDPLEQLKALHFSYGGQGTSQITR